MAIDGGEYRQWCFFLPEGWRDYLSARIEEVCAFQYSAMNGAILAARELVSGERWIEIRYEDLLADPVVAFRAAFEGCGLRFSAELKAHCQTVLKTPYNAFSEIRLDKWREGAHAKKIARMLPGLSDIAERMGYSV